MFLFALLAAAQAAPAAPATPPAAQPGERTIIREVIVARDGKPADSAAKGKEEERREVIVIRDGKDSAAAGGPDRRIRIVDIAPGKGEERREVRILREPGAPGTRVAILSCDNGAKVDSQGTDKDGKKTHVMICAKGSGGNVSRAQQLREAAKRIEADPNLSAEARARIAVAINEAIAKLPANE